MIYIKAKDWRCLCLLDTLFLRLGLTIVLCNGSREASQYFWIHVSWNLDSSHIDYPICITHYHAVSTINVKRLLIYVGAQYYLAVWSMQLSLARLPLYICMVLTLAIHLHGDIPPHSCGEKRDQTTEESNLMDHAWKGIKIKIQYDTSNRLARPDTLSRDCI